MTPGMYASAAIHIEKHDNALTVPVQAVGGRETPDVWVVERDGKVEDRPVKIGIQTPSSVEILSGLKEGEQVVFGSRGVTSPGMRVQPHVVKGNL